MLAINKIRHGFVCIRTSPDEELSVGGQCASRVGARGIAGQRKGLAAAAAPVDLAPFAGATGLRHPIRPAKPFERGGTIPDVGKARSRYGRKIEACQCL